MDATEAAKSVTEWAVATCPELSNAYDHNPNRIQHALPVALAGASDEGDTPADPQLGIEVAEIGLEQATVHVLRFTIELMVEPDPADTAAEQLEGFVAALAAAIRAERDSGEVTLGGRVDAASPYWQAAYEPPFVEFDDGVTARRATFSLAVAELI